jgi:hypothetical protein
MRAVMDVLRQATAALSASEIARLVLAERGVAEPDSERMKLTTRSVNISLGGLGKRGLATFDDATPPKRWRLT